MAGGLRELDHLPPGFLQARPEALEALLGGPVLIHLPGRRTPALFVSILLHGNEHTGLRAVQRLLARADGRVLPRALTIHVGNVAAARLGVRRLDGEPDHNRVWPGTFEPDGPERAHAEAVTATMRARGVFASVDVHNNTGLNPHYGCITRLDVRTLHLAALFARVAVAFTTTPRGTQTAAFAEFAPSIAIECGKSGQAGHDTHALAYLEACLHMADLPDHAVAPHDLELYRTVCRVAVADGVGFGVAPSDAALVLDARLDHLNFRELPAGAALGRMRDTTGPLSLQAFDDDGRDVTERVLERTADGSLCLRRRLMPAMLTLDVQAIRQDCLGYLMERLPLPGGG